MTSNRVSGISIVIPTYNRARLLGPTLESVKALQLASKVPVELLVIDNRCTDETPQIIERAAEGSPFPIVRIVEEQQGLCYGRNRGLREAQYSEVIFIDDDIEIAPEWIHGYLQAVQELNADCVVGPVTPKFEIEVPSILTQEVLDSVSSPYSRKGAIMKLLPQDVAHEVPGCNFGVRKSVAQEIGGFDNSLDRTGGGLLAGGDFEFGERIVAASKRVVYQPRCSILHVITADKLSQGYMRRRWRGVGATRRIMEKNRLAIPLLRRLLYVGGAGRLIAAGFLCRIQGKKALAFQRELEARSAWGYLNPPRRLNGHSQPSGPEQRPL